MDQTLKVMADGTRYWYSNGLLHRTDGPAIEYCTGTSHWMQNGLLHRVDGPAVEDRRGDHEWWINGVQLTESQFDQVYAQRMDQAALT